MTIKDNQDYTEKAIARLPNQFVDSTNLINLVSLNSDRMQGINDEAIKMLDGMSLSTASGKQLDNLATILNLTRIVGESDADFRARILSETAVLAKSGEPSHVIDVYLLLTEASQVFFDENYPAGIELTAHSTELENLIKFSEEFDQAAIWTGNATVTANTDVAPDGELKADKIEDTSNTLFHSRQQTITPFDAGETYTLAVKVKKDSTARATRFPQFLISFTGGAASEARISLDTSTGEFSLSGAAVITGNVIDYDADYWLIYVTGKATDISNDFMSFGLFPAFGASAIWAQSSATLGSVIITEGQLSKTALPIDYVKTTSEPFLFDSALDEVIINSMTNVKAGGIDMILLLSPETDFFFFDSEANVDASGDGTSDSSGGFGSTLDVEGGQLSRVLV